MIHRSSSYTLPLRASSERPPPLILHETQVPARSVTEFGAWDCGCPTTLAKIDWLPTWDSDSMLMDEGSMQGVSTMQAQHQKVRAWHNA